MDLREAYGWHYSGYLDAIRLIQVGMILFPQGVMFELDDT